MSNGMSFIGHRWVFTGPTSYEARPAVDGSGDWIVEYVTAAGRRPLHRCTPSNSAPSTPEAHARKFADELNERL